MHHFEETVHVLVSSLEVIIQHDSSPNNTIAELQYMLLDLSSTLKYSIY